MRSVRVGIIGAGLRGGLVLGPRLIELESETGLRVVALADRNRRRLGEVALYLQALALRRGTPRRLAKYIDYSRLIDDPEVDLILITTPTWTHAQIAERALASGKYVYLDKPIAVTINDSARIVAASRDNPHRMIMGFTRRYERSWRTARELLAEGRIGRLVMMQLRSVIPYTRYLHTWHRENARSGGALNDKSSHHFDVFRWFAGSECDSLTAVGGRSAQFTPEADPPSGCFACSRDCPYDLRRDPDYQEMGIKILPPSWRRPARQTEAIDTCVFAPGADIVDHCFATLSFAEGVVASLFLCIYGPKAPDQETLELVGSKGRLLLTRSTGEIKLYSEYGRRQERIDTRDNEFGSSHFGADRELVRALKQFVDGHAPVASAEDGHESLRLVTAAQLSIDAGGRVVDIGPIA